ncbi:MAG: hypothetical protein KJ017_11205 [Alphaproteobacteria bacterium]|nr:hypothetical protein [Alphaproteobacteria bacterium]
MELLVILLGEFLFFPFIAAAATAISAVFAFIGAIIDFLIFMPIYRNHREKGDEYLLKAHKKASPYPFRAVSTIASCVCLLLIPFIVMLNLFFFEPTVRQIAAQVAQQKGMQISFESAQGNLFTGLVELRGLTVKTENGARRITICRRSMFWSILMFTACCSARLSLSSLLSMGYRAMWRARRSPRRRNPPVPSRLSLRNPSLFRI